MTTRAYIKKKVTPNLENQKIVLFPIVEKMVFPRHACPELLSCENAGFLRCAAYVYLLLTGYDYYAIMHVLKHLESLLKNVCSKFFGRQLSRAQFSLNLWANSFFVRKFCTIQTLMENFGGN